MNRRALMMALGLAASTASTIGCSKTQPPPQSADTPAQESVHAQTTAKPVGPDPEATCRKWNPIGHRVDWMFDACRSRHFVPMGPPPVRLEHGAWSKAGELRATKDAPWKNKNDDRGG